MDKKYQDIHYRDINKQDVFVHRQVTIRNVKFKETCIEIEFTESELDPKTLLYGSFVKTIIIPKLRGYSLVID